VPKPSQEGRDEVLPLGEELPGPGAGPSAGGASGRAAGGGSTGRSASWSQTASWVGKAIDAADAILEQGLYEQASVLYKQVLQSVPNHPQALLRLGEIAARHGTDPSGEMRSLEDTSVDADALHGATGGGNTSSARRAAQRDSGASPKEVEFDVDLDEQAPAPSPAPRAAAKPKAPEVEVGGLLDAADLEGALEGIGVRSAEGAGQEDEFDLAAALGEGGQGEGSAETEIQDVFRAFKKGIEDQIGEKEWSAHYDLAIAYREMGLIEDAVEQLGIVARGGNLGIEGVALLATCKMELGAPEDAIKLLLSALERDVDADTRTALHYDLAEAYLAAGSREQALAEFQVVSAEQPQYREVQERMAELG
jgi:tetratricopeptide (TPR) repeat protein